MVQPITTNTISSTTQLVHLNPIRLLAIFLLQNYAIRPITLLLCTAFAGQSLTPNPATI